MNHIIEVTDLNKSYRDFSLENISFSVPEGFIAGFVGVNGAGKTTTIKTLLGLSQKSSGSIRMFGMDMNQNEQAIKERIGVVLDEGCFYDELTLNEMKNIIAPAYKLWNEREFREYLDRFSLNPKQTIKTLSKGMKMKYALALALSHEAELLIMDEPTSGLDPLIRQKFLEIMSEYMEKWGKGILFSTHITSDLDKIADMLIMIEKGRIILQEDKDTLLDNYRLIKGDPKALDAETRKLIFNINETAFVFTGITKEVDKVRRRIPDIIVERPAMEDIMLGNIEEGRKL